MYEKNVQVATQALLLKWYFFILFYFFVILLIVFVQKIITNPVVDYVDFFYRKQRVVHSLVITLI